MFYGNTKDLSQVHDSYSRKLSSIMAVVRKEGLGTFDKIKCSRYTEHTGLTLSRGKVLKCVTACDSPV